ncbi:MAG: hypothetical protein K0R39_2927 [Symbiobacteriaceae bacterium]|jgi:hypothetical protein|nr:hypothetical protein [Symbiobacteriaceae bacterium]
MKRLLALLLALTALVAVGCSAGGAPKVTTPEAKYDFGDVLTTEDPKYHEFFIKNEGKGDLKISGVQVKLLKGC